MKRYLIALCFMLCATPIHATNVVQSWLASEEKVTEKDAFDTWYALYESFIKQEDAGTYPTFIQHDALISQLIYISMQHHKFAIAEELTSQIKEQGLRLYVRLAVHRAAALFQPADKEKEWRALLRIAQQIWPQQKEYYHFLNAVTTAWIECYRGDIATLTRQLMPLLHEQKIARHRAYGVHRLHLFVENNASPSKLDTARIEALLATKHYDAALHAVAIAPLYQQLKLRNDLLLELHEATREQPALRPLALSALWLMQKDTQQEQALVDYVGWLAESGEMAEATQITNQIEQRKAIIKATYHLRDGYDSLKQEPQRKAAIERIDALKSVVEQAPLETVISPTINPFQTLRPYNLFVNTRLFTAQLTQPQAKICMADAHALPPTPKPFAALVADDSYGTDDAGNHMAWTMMLLTSRALANDAQATPQLKALLLQWANAEALEETQPHHNNLYALKRLLLPIVHAAQVAQESFSTEEKETIFAWLERLTQQATQHFAGKEVEKNNHRYLADAVLLADGILRANPARYNEGKQGFYRAVSQIDAVGNLPLEVVRGSRALWYMRQSLATLTTMAYMMQLQGDTPSNEAMQALERLAHCFISASYNPLLLLPYAAANVTAGEEGNIFKTDMGMFTARPTGRHYMAFAAYWNILTPRATVPTRLQALLTQYAKGASPWIDEFAGGNARCFIGE